MTATHQLNDITVFDADHGDFEFRLAAKHLRHQKLIILLAKTDKENASTMGLNWLGSDERRRYHDYICRNAATQFLTARTLIRKVLMHYLNLSPTDIRISSIQHSKPFVACDRACGPIPQFNISHSGAWVSIALHADLPLGLDIECSEAPELDKLCESEELFNQNDRNLLAACADQDHRADFFYRLWRGKEAIMKATGKGFALEPCKIDLLSDNGRFKNVVTAEGRSWRLHEISTHFNLEMAVAVQHCSDGSTG